MINKDVILKRKPCMSDVCGMFIVQYDGQTIQSYNRMRYCGVVCRNHMIYVRHRQYFLDYKKNKDIQMHALRREVKHRSTLRYIMDKLGILHYDMTKR